MTAANTARSSSRRSPVPRPEWPRSWSASEEMRSAHWAPVCWMQMQTSSRCRPARRRAPLALAVALCTVAALCASCSGPSVVPSEDFDVLVYGGTSAGVTAAVQASRMGASVALVAPETHLGGLSSGGLGWTDLGDKSVIGGLARVLPPRLAALPADRGMEMAALRGVRQPWPGHARGRRGPAHHVGLRAARRGEDLRRAALRARRGSAQE